MTRDVSVGKFREFLGVRSQWDGLPAYDALTRLAYLVKYFSMCGGYRRNVLAALAWNNGFSTNPEFSGRSFRTFLGALEKAIRRVSASQTTVRPTGESVYDQFEASLRDNVVQVRPTPVSVPAGPRVATLRPRPQKEHPPADFVPLDINAMQKALENLENQTQRTKSITGE